MSMEAVSTLVAALVIAFVYSWKLTLVILCFLPVMVIAGKVQGSVVAGSATSEKTQLSEAGKVL
jgi:ABC-type bacteriocin/lantibiotic exporter with double-glycine peptidase domain